MAHPDMKTVVLSLGPNETQEDIDNFNHAVEMLDEAHDQAVQQLVDTLHISESDARKIHYLRSRSRWTQEKENYLILLAQEGDTLPNVFTGEY